jgi:hypothetical protein
VRLQTVPKSACRAVLPSLGRFARRLNAIEACLTSDLTPPARCGYISTMKALIQTGSSLSACGHAQAGGRVPVPPEKRFLINFEKLELGLLPRTTFDIDQKFFDEFKA